MTSKRYLKYVKTPKGQIARNRAYRTYSKKQRNNLIELLGGVCVRCGFLDKRALQVDHINGDGKQDRLIGLRRINEYLKEPEIARKNLQVLCANCNWIKRFDNGENKRIITIMDLVLR